MELGVSNRVRGTGEHNPYFCPGGGEGCNYCSSEIRTENSYIFSLSQKGIIMSSVYFCCMKCAKLWLIQEHGV